MRSCLQQQANIVYFCVTKIIQKQIFSFIQHLINYHHYYIHASLYHVSFSITMIAKLIVRYQDRHTNKTDRKIDKYTYKHRNTDVHTHTHTHTYIYVCVCVCVCVYISRLTVTYIYIYIYSRTCLWRPLVGLDKSGRHREVVAICRSYVSPNF